MKTIKIFFRVYYEILKPAVDVIFKLSKNYSQHN